MRNWRWAKLSAVQKAVVGLTALIVVLEVSLGLSLLAHEKRTLSRQLDERARTLAQIAAAVGAVSNTDDAAQRAVKLGHTLRMQKEVLFCEIKDSKGNVEYREGTPHPGQVRQYTFPLGLDEARAGSNARATSPDPLAEGTLTIGLSLHSDRRALAETRATVATSVMASLGITWLFAGLLLRNAFLLPIRRLLQKARGACGPSVFENTRAGDDDESGKSHGNLPD